MPRLWGSAPCVARAATSVVQDEVIAGGAENAPANCPWGGSSLLLRRSECFWSSFLGAGALPTVVLVSACSSAQAPASEPVGITRSAITGGDTASAQSSTALPDRAVGLVTTPLGNCSGTLILRNVV